MKRLGVLSVVSIFRGLYALPAFARSTSRHPGSAFFCRGAHPPRWDGLCDQKRKGSRRTHGLDAVADVGVGGANRAGAVGADLDRDLDGDRDQASHVADPGEVVGFRHPFGGLSSQQQPRTTTGQSAFAFQSHSDALLCMRFI